MRLLRSVVPALAGVVAGVTSSFFLKSQSGPQQGAAAASQPPAVVAAVSRAPARDAPHDRAVDDLSRRLARLEDAGATTARAPDPEPPPMDPEQRKAALLGAHQASIKKHWAEPIDPAWSPRATSTVREDLQPVAADKHFKIVEVDCRTSTCVSTIEWPDHRAAVKGYGDVLHVPYRANCTRSIILSDATDPSAPFRATLILDCEEQRANGQLNAL